MFYAGILYQTAILSIKNPLRLCRGKISNQVIHFDLTVVKNISTEGALILYFSK